MARTSRADVAPRVGPRETVVALMRTADRVRRDMTRALEPYDITLQQYNVLRILQASGTAGMPTLEVANRMIEQVPGITRLLERLAAKHYIRRERCKEDRRQHLCWLTPKGVRLLDTLIPLIQASHARVVGRLAEAERRGLVELLNRLETPNDAPA
jgi:DNA-binding MarR family transcriptional regulator